MPTSDLQNDFIFEELKFPHCHWSNLQKFIPKIKTLLAAASDL